MGMTSADGIGMQEDVWGRATGDSEFLEDLRTAYAGRHNVLDALWWYCNPLETAPSGIPSPESALATLRNAVFSTRSEETRRLESEKLQVLTDMLAQDRRDIVEAIAIAVAEKRATSRLGGTLEPSPCQPSVAGPTEPSSDRLWRRSAVRSLLLVAGALLIGIWIGFTLSRPASSDDPSATAEASSVRALGIFDRSQTANDIPTSSIGPEFRAETIRRLTVQEGMEEEFFVARGREEDVCLIVQLQDGLYNASCVNSDDFASSGLVVHWAARHPASFLTGSEEPVLMDGVITWTADGAGIPTLTPREIATGAG